MVFRAKFSVSTILEGSQNSSTNINLSPGRALGNFDLRGVSPHIYSEGILNPNATENAYYNAFQFQAMFTSKSTGKHPGEDIYYNADNTPAV